MTIALCRHCSYFPVHVCLDTPYTADWALDSKRQLVHVSRDRNLQGLGMSHAMTASLKLSFRAPWRMSDAMVGRGNAGWTASKSGHPCPCQNCSQGPSAQKTGRGSLLNCPSCPCDNPFGQGIELN